jgi:predicted nucleic acid-binding protein
VTESVRQRGPLSERTWSAVNDAVILAARHVLAARRIATFDSDAVHLACLETVAAQLNTPEAVCLIVA